MAEHQAGACLRCLAPAERHPTADCGMSAALAQRSSESDWTWGVYDGLRELERLLDSRAAELEAGTPPASPVDGR